MVNFDVDIDSEIDIEIENLLRQFENLKYTILDKKETDMSLDAYHGHISDHIYDIKSVASKINKLIYLKNRITTGS